MEWSNGHRSKENPADLKVIDRFLSPGDVVMKTEGAECKLGTVTSLSMLLSLETSGGKKLKNVNVKNVKPVHPFQPSAYVIHGQWLGRVYTAVCDVTVLFDDGAVCIAHEADYTRVKPTGSFEETDMPTYFPSQKVKLTKKALKEADWMAGKNNKKRNSGIVVDVEVVLVLVDWIMQAGWAAEAAPPPGEVLPADLKVLDYFGNFDWSLLDHCLLKKDVAKKDASLEQDGPFESAPLTTLKGKNNNKGAKVLAFLKENVAKVTGIISQVNITWQDGTTSAQVPTVEVAPLPHTPDKEFFPDDFVVSAENPTDFGVVKRVNASEQTCTVKWSPTSSIHADRLDREGCENDVPVFSLLHHPLYDFRVGSLVILLPAEGQEGTKCGFVIGKEDLKIRVVWDDKSVTLEEPDRLFLVASEDDDDGDLMLDGMGEGEGGEEDEEDQVVDMSAFSATGGFGEGGFGGLGEFTGFGNTFSFSAPAGKVKKAEDPETYEKLKCEAKLVVVQFGTSWSMACVTISPALEKLSEQHEEVLFVTVDVEQAKEIEDGKDVKEHPTFKLFLQGKLVSSFEGADEQKLQGEVERWKSSPQADNKKEENKEEKKEETCAPVVPVHSSEIFQVLDGVPSSHFYLLPQPQPSPKFSKAVTKEWSVLQSLPSSGIFVRAFEGRIDLMKVLIVGPEKTPFYGNVFCFDVSLPSDFPLGPPLVHFISHVSERMHPNLYETGKVCLSLLGTWGGSESERWSTSSTLLQLFVSLQGLILSVPEPYFCEAGLEKTRGTKLATIASKLYNENSLLLSLRSITLQLQSNNPPEFTQIIRAHLKEKREEILQHCRKYLGKESAELPEKFGVPFGTCSTGFKKMLERLFPSLEEHLSKL